MIRNVFILFLLLFHLTTVAQVEINPIFPEDGLFMADQLYDVTLTNSSSEVINGNLAVTVMRNGNEPVLKISSFPMKLHPGQPVLGYDINWSPQMGYGNNEASTSLRESGMLPLGYYIFCYSFISGDGSIDKKSCQEVTIKGMSPPELMDPLDGSVISVAPILVWMPPMLSSPTEGVRYHLKLVELSAGQAPELGVKQNIPLMQLRDIAETQIVFSSDFGNLEDGKTYAWQVDGYIKDFSLGVTEIWTFTYGEPDSKDRIMVPESYRMVKRQRNSGIYSANSKLYFGYDNWIGEEELNYSLVSMGEGTIKRSANLPRIELKGGLNRVVLDCESIGLENRQKYSLVITDPKGVKYYLDFKYFSRQKK